MASYILILNRRTPDPDGAYYHRVVGHYKGLGYAKNMADLVANATVPVFKAWECYGEGRQAGQVIVGEDGYPVRSTNYP